MQGTRMKHKSVLQKDSEKFKKHNFSKPFFFKKYNFSEKKTVYCSNHPLPQFYSHLQVSLPLTNIKIAHIFTFLHSQELS